MSDRQQLIKVLFHAVAELETDEARRAYLDDQCSDNAQLKQEVLGLFAHDRQLGSFMERKQEQAVMAMDMPSEDSFHESIDETIGPYTLREKLGVGGMGIVYVAEQTEPVHRKVALKIIKPGMDSKEVLARFEAERQALAMMSHPNIAKILDGGTTKQGRPYFVMELVRGIPITEFSDQHKLDTPQRLELFIKVCKAVQHAHLKGIIHRDLKPSNVMVEVQDVEAVPKVIDFGIAKAINQRLSQHTVYTPYAQLIGTPMYMSPEQAQLSGLDVDTRSDIYSLGVLLYELLTGTTPFERETLEKSGFDEMRRMICDVDPPKPSVRLSTLNAAALSTIADRRRVDPRKLHQSLHGELDWIVMKALEKDRKRRYESASDFAADIQRYLNNEPIEACPPSTVYRLKKFAQRNKSRLLVATVGATLLLVALAVGVSAKLKSDGLLRQLTADVDQSMAAARAAIETGDLAVAHRRIGEANGRLIGADKALPQLTATVEQLSVEIDDRREQQQRLLKFEQLARDAMDNMSYDMNLGGEKQAAQALDLYGVLSDDHWLDRLQASYLNKQQQSMVQQTAYETLLSLADFGVRWSKRSTEESTTVSLRYLEQAEAFHPPTRAYYWVRRECLKFVNKLEEAERDLKLFQSTAATTAFDYYLPGHTAGWGGDLKEAIRSYEAALRMQPDHFNSLFFLATRLDSGGRKAEAVQIWRACLALRPDHIPTLRNRALALSEQGEFEEALESVNKAIELKSNSAFAFQARASIYQAMQEYDKASADLDQAHELARDDQVLGVVYTRALGYARQGQYDAALADLSTVLEIAPKHERGHGVRGVALKSLGRFDEALAALNEAIKIDPQFANFYLERSQVYCGLKQYDHALPDIERAIELTTNPKPEIYQRRSSVHVGLKNYEQAVADMLKAIEIDPKYSIAYNNLAWLRITCPDPAYRDVSQAVDFATKAVELAPHNGDVWNTLGVAQYRASDLTTAVKSLTTSLEKKGDVESPESDFFLAMAHWRLGDHDEAREWYEKAVKIMTVNKSTDEELLRFRAEAEETLGIETEAPIPEKSDSQSYEAVISSEKTLQDVPPTNLDLP